MLTRRDHPSSSQGAKLLYQPPIPFLATKHSPGALAGRGALVPARLRHLRRPGHTRTAWCNNYCSSGASKSPGPRQSFGVAEFGVRLALSLSLSLSLSLALSLSLSLSLSRVPGLPVCGVPVFRVPWAVGNTWADLRRILV